SGTEFNIVAAKIPYLKSINGVSSGGQYTYTFTGVVNIPLTRMFYPGQRIISYNSDMTLTSFSGNNNDINSISADSPLFPEFVVSTTSNSVTTTTANPGTNPPGPVGSPSSFTGGNLTVMNKLRPDPVLSGILTNYRLLGVVSTDGSGGIREFSYHGTCLSYKEPTTGAFYLTSINGGHTSFDCVKDCGLHVPAIAREATIYTEANIQLA